MDGTPTVTKVRILVADDHDVVRDGLRLLLQSHPGFEICGEAADGREAVALALAQRPDVVVLDFSMPELNGLEATRQIRKALPGTEVLLLTMHDPDLVAREVLAAGARALLVKSDARRHLVTAIEALARHQAFLPPELSRALLEEWPHQGGGLSGAEPHDPLTPRQREVLQLIAEGHSSKAIAAGLGLSVRTVDAHRANIMQALGLHSVSELVRYAVRHHIVEP